MIQRLIPYSPEVYHSQLGYYYQATSPAHLLAIGIGLLLLVLVARPSARGPLISQLIIASFWIWTGAIFHRVYFAELNWAAEYFGYAFIAQGLLVGLHAILYTDKVYQTPPLARVTGCVLVVVAMIFSPTIAAVAEAPIATAHLFGITPLPLIIATWGVLLVSAARLPLWLLVIPLIWTVWEGLIAHALGLWPDVALAVISGAGGLFLITLKARKSA